MFRGIVAAAVLCALTAPAFGQTPVLIKQGDFEVQTPRLSGQQSRGPYVFGDGIFVAYENLADAADKTETPTRLIVLDAITGEITNITQPRKDRNFRPIFILEDHVIASSGSFNRISILDRKTGVELGSKRLEDDVRDAYIDGDTLYLLQQGRLSRFTVNGMEFLSEGRLAFSGAEARLIKRGMVRIHPQMKSMEFQVALTSYGGASQSITLAKPAGIDLQYCRPRLTLVGEHHAVVDRGCGHYAVIDLDELREVFDVRLIPGANQPTFTLLDHFLVVRTEPYGPETPAPVSVIDLATGRELARQILPDGTLYGFSDTLVLAQHPSSWTGLAVTTYSIDIAAAVNITRQAADIRAAFAEARKTDDPYRAIEIMNAVTIDPMVEAIRTGLGKTSAEILGYYARMLVMDPTRATAGIDLLAQLAAQFPDAADFQADLARARRSALIYSVNATAREPALSALWKPAGERPLRTARTLGPGVVSWWGDKDFLIFDGKLAFLAQGFIGEDGEVKNGVDIYDRDTWQKIKRLEVADSSWGSDDREREIPDFITGLAVANDRLWVSITPNHYKGPEQKTMFVYDLKTMKLLKSWHHRAMNSFVVASGKTVIAYSCSPMEGPRAYDAETLEPVAVDMSDVCPGSDTYSHAHVPPGSPLQAYRRALQLDMRSQLISDDYLVVRGFAPNGLRYSFFPMEGAAGPITLPRAVSRTRSVLDERASVYLSEKQDIAIVLDQSKRAASFIAFDLKAGTWKTLLGMPSAGYVDAATDGRTLFAAFDKSIIAIDIRTGDVIDFADVLSDAPLSDPQNNGGVRIDALRVDQNRLIAFADQATAIIDLKAFYGAIDGKPTPYATIRRHMMRD